MKRKLFYRKEFQGKCYTQSSWKALYQGSPALFMGKRGGQVIYESISTRLLNLRPFKHCFAKPDDSWMWPGKNEEG